MGRRFMMNEMKISRAARLSDRRKNELKRRISAHVMSETCQMSLSLGDMSRDLYKDFQKMFGTTTKVTKGGSLYGRKKTR